MNKDHLIRITEHEYRLGGHFHILKTGRMPNRIAIRDYDKSRCEHLLEKIREEYEWEKENYVREERHTEDGKIIFYHLLHLDSGITLHKSNGTMVLLFDAASDKGILDEIKELVYSIKTGKNTRQNIGIIISRGPGLSVQTFEYTLPETSVIEYLDADLQEFHQKMTRQLEAKNGSGLYLMYGEPGTGKTTFIKDVLSRTTKQALFISPFFTENLTAPNLISLLMDYPDSILVIEDAETVLMERKADNSSAVSNLLNLTDGFLADFLNLKIICTFNTELNNIDKALLRDGRLKGMHEFTKVQPEKAKDIAGALGRDIDPDGPMTLAEICAENGAANEFEPSKIGFSDFPIEKPFN